MTLYLPPIPSLERKDRETFYTLVHTVFNPPTPGNLSLRFRQARKHVFVQNRTKNLIQTNYTTEHGLFTSADGTRVPMFISYKKG